MIVLIDNYDSFVYNLARYVEREGEDVVVIRNDAPELIKTCDAADGIIISPGPCSPAEAGLSKEIISRLGQSIPILGVCLGHQAIGEVYGGKTIRSDRPVHGKTSTVYIKDNCPLLATLSSEFQAARYHSLIIDLPEHSKLKITAETEDNIIMAVTHEEFPVYGIQFHPESILTETGDIIIRNFLNIVRANSADKKKI